MAFFCVAVIVIVFIVVIVRHLICWHFFTSGQVLRNNGRRRSSHSELLDAELQATGCTHPTPQQCNQLLLPALCPAVVWKTTRAACSMELDCGYNYYWPTSLLKQCRFVWLHCKQTHRLLLLYFWKSSCWASVRYCIKPHLLVSSVTTGVSKSTTTEILRIATWCECETVTPCRLKVGSKKFVACSSLQLQSVWI